MTWRQLILVYFWIAVAFVAGFGVGRAWGAQDVVKVTVTAYSPTRAETDSTPFYAKCGWVQCRTVALSRDLFRILNVRCGALVYITGVGFRVVNDTMHRRWRRKVDLFFWDRRYAKWFGRQRAVLVVVTRKTGLGWSWARAGSPAAVGRGGR